MTIVNPEDTGELALIISGKKKKFARTHFEDLGKGLGLTPKQIESVFKRFNKNKKVTVNWSANSFLSENMKLQYLNILEERYDRIYPRHYPIKSVSLKYRGFSFFKVEPFFQI